MTDPKHKDLATSENLSSFLNTFGQNNSAFDFDGSTLPTALNQASTTSRQIQLGLKLIW